MMTGMACLIAQTTAREKRVKLNCESVDSTPFEEDALGDARHVTLFT
jgi:hypothetical protein